MSWRPDSWENPHDHRIKLESMDIGSCEIRDNVFIDMEKEYEAGADAMLEALKARGKKLKETGLLRDAVSALCELYNLEGGWLVLIPEETKGG